MHLPIKMIRQPPIIIQPTQIRAAHIADLQLLVAAGPRRIGQGLELRLVLGLCEQGGADPHVLLEGARDQARRAQDLDLEQARLDARGEVADLLQQRVGLADLVGRLLEAALRRVDASVALVDVLLQVAQVVELEGVRRRVGLVLVFQRLAVDFGAGPEVLLRVREEVVRAGAHEVGAAELGVCDGELGGARGGGSAHELLWGMLVQCGSLEVMDDVGGSVCGIGAGARKETKEVCGALTKQLPLFGRHGECVVYV